MSNVTKYFFKEVPQKLSPSENSSVSARFTVGGHKTIFEGLTDPEKVTLYELFQTEQVNGQMGDTGAFNLGIPSVKDWLKTSKAELDSLRLKQKQADEKKAQEAQKAQEELINGVMQIVVGGIVRTHQIKLLKVDIKPDDSPTSVAEKMKAFHDILRKTYLVPILTGAGVSVDDSATHNKVHAAALDILYSSPYEIPKATKVYDGSTQITQYAEIVATAYHRHIMNYKFGDNDDSVKETITAEKNTLDTSIVNGYTAESGVAAGLGKKILELLMPQAMGNLKENALGSK